MLNANGLRPSIPNRPSEEEQATHSGLPLPWFFAGAIGILLLVYFVWRALH